MLICLTGYCMAKSGFDRTITQPPKLFQLRKLEIQQSLRIDSTVYLIYWWWFPTPVVRCAVSHNSDVPKVTPYFVCKLLFMGIASFYTLLRNNRINWNVQCWSMLKLILSQGSKRDSLVQPGDFPGEVPREKACAMTCKCADAELSVVRVGHLATAFWNWARWDTMGYWYCTMGYRPWMISWFVGPDSQMVSWRFKPVSPDSQMVSWRFKPVRWVYSPAMTCDGGVMASAEDLPEERKEMFAVLALRVRGLLWIWGSQWVVVCWTAFSDADCHDSLETAWDSFIEAKWFDMF